MFACLNVVHIFGVHRSGSPARLYPKRMAITKNYYAVTTTTTTTTNASLNGVAIQSDRLVNEELMRSKPRVKISGPLACLGLGFRGPYLLA